MPTQCVPPKKPSRNSDSKVPQSHIMPVPAVSVRGGKSSLHHAR